MWTLRHHIEKLPESVGAKVNLAKVLVLQGRQGEGEKLLQEVLAREPARFEALTVYLQFLLQNDRYKGAIDALEKARAAVPDLLLAAMEGDLLVRSGEPGRAVALLGGVAEGGGSPPVLGALGRAQVAAGLNEAAKGTYRRLVAVAPGLLEGRRAQVALLLQLREVDAAKAALREALVAMPGSWPVMSALVALEGQTGGLAASLQMAADIRADGANMPGAALLRGDALVASRRFGEAVAAYRAEQEGAPSSVLVRRLATAAMGAGEGEVGAAALRAWLAGHGEDVEAARMLAWLEVGAQHYQQAAGWYEMVLARRPGDLVAMNNLAWVYQAEGDGRARGMAQRAYLQAPSAQTADTLGWIMVQQGDAKGAVGLLRQVRVGPQGGVAGPALGYHLAVALERDGKGAEAASVLRPILAGGAAFADRAAAVALLERVSGR